MLAELKGMRAEQRAERAEMRAAMESIGKMRRDLAKVRWILDDTLAATWRDHGYKVLPENWSEPEEEYEEGRRSELESELGDLAEEERSSKSGSKRPEGEEVGGPEVGGESQTMRE